jgi:catalase
MLFSRMESFQAWYGRPRQRPPRRGGPPDDRRCPANPADGDDRDVLTTRQGHPVYDDQNQRTVGDRGPATLENYQFLEKISHFDRERIPERVVHARGTTAFGFFEAYGRSGDEPISTYTRAKLFQEEVFTPKPCIVR